MASKPGDQRSVFRVPESAHQLRLDQALAQCVPGLSRRMARVLIDLGGVFVNRKRVKVASRAVQAGQVISVTRGGAFERASKATGRAARAEDEAALPDVPVIYEDEHVVAVHKPPGLLSAPTPESDRNNVLSVLGATRAPLFLVHRLDLQASGVMLLAKSERMNHLLAELFREHALTRQYEVFAAGALAQSPTEVDAPLRGKRAKTVFVLLAQHERFCQLEATLYTGRTHQIRLHLLGLGLPVLADPRYAKREPWHPARLALHARLLELRHPATGETLRLEAPLAEDLAGWLAQNAAAAPAGSAP